VFQVVQHPILFSQGIKWFKSKTNCLRSAAAHLTIVLLFLGASAMHAQLPTDEEELKDIEMLLNNGAPPVKGWRYQLNADISSPHLIMNPANARAFDGIAMASLQFGVQTARNLYIGVYGRYTGFLYYKPSFIGDMNVQQRLRSTNLGSGIYASYVRVYENGIGWQAQLSGGYHWMRYHDRIVEKQFTNLDFWDFSIQGSGGLYYFPFQNHQTGIGLQLGLTYFNHEFRKNTFGLTAEAELEKFSDRGPTMHINVGLSLIFNLRARNY